MWRSVNSSLAKAIAPSLGFSESHTLSQSCLYRNKAQLNNKVSEEEMKFQVKQTGRFGIYLHLRQTTRCIGQQISLELGNQILEQKV
jgi:hypothetical protein